MLDVGGAWVAKDSEFTFRSDGSVYIDTVWTWMGMGIIRVATGDAYIVVDPETGLLERVEDEQED